jgi:hypothetical protein
MLIPAWSVVAFVLEVSPFSVTVPARILNPGLISIPDKLPEVPPV